MIICIHDNDPRRAVVSYWRKYVHEVLVNRLGGQSLPRKSVVRLTDRPDMTLDVYLDVKQQYNNNTTSSVGESSKFGLEQSKGLLRLQWVRVGVVWTYFLSSIISLFFLPLSGRPPDID